MTEEDEEMGCEKLFSLYDPLFQHCFYEQCPALADAFLEASRTELDTSQANFTKGAGSDFQGRGTVVLDRLPEALSEL